MLGIVDSSIYSTDNTLADRLLGYILPRLGGLAATTKVLNFLMYFMRFYLEKITLCAQRIFCGAIDFSLVPIYRFRLSIESRVQCSYKPRAEDNIQFLSQSIYVLDIKQ